MQDLNKMENSVIATFVNDDQASLIDWFSQLLIHPLDEQMILTYASETMLSFLVGFGEEFECQELVSDIRQQLTEDNAKQVQHNLSWSYTLMFEGISGPRSISLYESGYYGDGSRLFQQPFIDMQSILQELDFSVTAHCREPVDHISIELAALSQAIRQNHIEIFGSLHQRLMRWLPKLLADVGAAQFKGFYHNILLLLEVYLASFYCQSTAGSNTYNPS